MQRVLSALALSLAASIPSCVPNLDAFGVAQSCADGTRGEDETDIDCGGENSCRRCEDGRGCSGDSDCQSHYCLASVCVMARCADQQRNGGESATDCGGPTACARCANDLHCEEDSDCVSAYCHEGACVAATCRDQRLNGEETDLDCGGSCEPCADGLVCQDNSDCVSGVCQRSICQSPKCTDERVDGGETDLDCGGETSCPRCEDGRGCSRDADCRSSFCLEAVCAPATCRNREADGLESDVDCGGPSPCARCDNGRNCERGTDCGSGLCRSQACLPATCGNGSTDEEETDLDCGGESSCERCLDRQHCLRDEDCQSRHCTRERCVPAACADGLTNHDETDLDCGGSSCAPCLDRESCAVDGDCASQHCYLGKCSRTMACDYTGELGSNLRKVHLAYLVPADRSARANYIANLERSVRHAQVFFSRQLPDARTFSLASPIVRVLQSAHPADWFNSARPPPSSSNTSFRDNVVAETASLLGPELIVEDTWLIYADAPPACDQLLSLGFGSQQVAGEGDLRGIAGLEVPSRCAGDSSIMPNPCRFVGGMVQALTFAWSSQYPAALSYPADLPTYTISTLDRSIYFGVENVGSQYCDCSVVVPE